MSGATEAATNLVLHPRLEIGNDPLGRNLSPIGKDRGTERRDVGEMPVEAAARHSQGLRQWIGLERAARLAASVLRPWSSQSLAES